MKEFGPVQISSVGRLLYQRNIPNDKSGLNIFPDPIMANAILDRLAHNAHQIVIKGESYRKKKRPILQNAKV